jgi:hypothetical protein
MLRLRRTAAALSALLNVAVLGGRPGEMTSGKLYRMRKHEACGWCAVVCRWLDALTGEDDHCWNAHVADQRRAHEYLAEVRSHSLGRKGKAAP